jgi:hypothetical protein
MVASFNLVFNFLDNFSYYAGGGVILLYNKYKVVEYYYNLYICLYPFYKALKKISLFIYFNLLKLYVVFINDSIFFNMSNSLWVLLFKLKKLIKYNFKLYNRRNFKLRKKYKYYYR